MTDNSNRQENEVTIKLTRQQALDIAGLLDDDVTIEEVTLTVGPSGRLGVYRSVVVEKLVPLRRTKTKAASRA